MPGEPLVTVLMAVYNDAAFVAESVSSILRQSLKDFEFLIIDDGSTDGTKGILARLADERSRVIHNERNIGLTASLNRGLDAARGCYVARMDGDDVAEPQRLEKQAAFLNTHLDIGVLGCSRRLIDEEGQELGVARALEEDLSIRWKCLLGNPFAHPTVMLRRELLAGHRLRYDQSFRTAQDYELWTRLLPHTRGANFAEPLLRYRLRNGISRQSKAEQLANHDRIALLANRRLLPSFPLNADQIRELRGRYGGHSVREPHMQPDDAVWLGIYRGMFEAFTAAHARHDGLASFRKTLRPPRPSAA